MVDALTEAFDLESSDAQKRLIEARLARGPRGLAEWLDEIRFPPERNLLLLVDQCEELFRFRHGDTGDDVDAFVALLLASARQRDKSIYVVITMRSEFLGDCTQFTGLAEMINDATTASWDNNTYSSYGGITRGTAGTIGQALSSTPTNVNGTIIYTTLENTYGNAEFGNIQPNLGVTTVKGYSYIKEKFQTQQRFNDTQDPAIGFNGLKFNAATLIKSRYAPGSDITTTSPQSTSNAFAVSVLTEMTGGAVTTYPALAVASSETLFWLNARKPFLNFYISDSPLFGFGFTGFKPAQGNTKVAGQVLAAAAITGEPRYHQQVYGFTA